VEPFDIGVWVMASLAMVTVAVAAAFVPARRATRVDPVATLRSQ
jgi:ABC-type lipoprotein release transport system permease subunit